jgi:hypothetical protein
VLDRQFLYRLEDEVNRARYEIDEKYHMGQAELRARFLQLAAMEQIRSLTEPKQPEKPTMAVTGAKFLADLIRTRQAQVKAQLAQAGNELNAVMDDMEATANEATKQVTEAKAEVADLKAALGLNSNGAPE